MAHRTHYVVVRTVFKGEEMIPISAPVAVFDKAEVAEAWVTKRTKTQGRHEYALHRVITEKRQKTLGEVLKALFGR